jgi:sensor histidine kinase YesM
MMARFRFAILYVATWIPAAAIYSVLIYFQTPDRDVYGAIWGGTQSVATAAILGLGVWAATRRLAERQRPVRTLVLAHISLSLAYTVLWTGVITLSIAVFAPAFVLQEYIRYGVGWQFLTGIFVYGMVAGIAHALTVTRRLRREREAAAKAEALRARAELSALRAQMNPHFLFNTLHSIAALVRTDPRAVEDALERLAHLLRRLLDANRAGVDQIALQDEWEIVRDQLELEKLRFGDRLNVATDFESDALECQIPTFTLQPLVENAVRHGVAARTQGCTLNITARIRNETLEMEVQDDGPGADLRTATNAAGLGLRAVRQRLLAQYGDRAGVHIETAPGRGFLVRVTLPAIESVTTRQAPVASAGVA